MTNRRTGLRKPRITKTTSWIGVDLGGTNVRAGLVAGSQLLSFQAKIIRSQGTANDVFEDLCQVIDAVAKPERNGIGGIGIGVPGLVNTETGVISDTTNIPSWKRVQLRALLEKKYGVPVRINNDANCFALGEKRFGCARQTNDFVGLIIGTGLGAGIVSRGHLISGTDCGAGEFGVIPYRDSIIEHYASGQFFRRFNRDGAELCAAARKREAGAQRIFDEYGRHLGHAVKIILFALAPELIILGGSVSRAFPHFRPALLRSLEDFTYPGVVKRLRFKVSTLENAAVLGAASLFDDLKSF